MLMKTSFHILNSITELFQHGQTTEATIKPISKGQTTKQPSEGIL